MDLDYILYGFILVTELDRDESPYLISDIDQIIW
ncbi:MAG: hypothetical protein Lokiarch_09220 [Candidatus Lokiarchaeum sp. GC14_75]|nr:MAG: hypothetical protein Lokiarch_09220 [Candidatus Lokiarchaeum sp. GC14_75]